ncbi:glutaredoxin family protein [Mesobacillus zeae]|uniref:Glutaredoxin family protein n=1 Tax=Mesobacillus zeae TaxID=1917180 RepID=A0A398BDD9_9BACI|nr:glutaredoxin family protein [Mesobacillus zeae]RID87827.1 glutaredoxin family protein [Mesobacillus zeae]
MTTVTVFTQDDCPPCKIVKWFLQDHGVDFTEKNITSDPSAKKELTEQYGILSTPAVIIQDQIFTGFDLPRLMDALGIQGN